MKKAIIIIDRRFQKQAKETERLLKYLEKIIPLTDAHVEVFLVGDKFMKKNVLSFPAPQNFPRPDLKGKRPIGEIYLNPDYIKTHGEEFDFMLVHGFLHLLGYDHKIKSDQVVMEQKEQEILHGFRG